MILARKLMLKHKIETSLASDNLKQVIFLGGGYDIRALISAIKFPNVPFYELDRGKTRQNKINILKHFPNNIGIENPNIKMKENGTYILNNNFYSIDCDFIKDDLEEILNQNGFKKGMKTLVIAEGLTMYLDKRNIERLLISVFNLLKEKDEFILSFIPKKINPLITSYTPRLSRERHCFALSPVDVVPFVAKYGFKVTHKNLFNDMLGAMGDITNLRLHEANSNLKKEHYYTLEKSSNNQEAGDNTIHDIPDYKFTIPSEIYGL
ncbi:class I SAM-dependent methyltransferase [Legionella pneumophila]|uniref:class I SAM-dependent methyltransferase n=1 Tax=Legionella pneumophila TaxID=446 RepID=UPI003EEC9AD4